MIYSYLKALIFHNLIYGQLITECQKKEFYYEKIKQNPLQMIPYFINYFLCIKGTYDQKKADQITAKIFNSYSKQKLYYVNEQKLTNNEQEDDAVLNLYTSYDLQNVFKTSQQIFMQFKKQPIFELKLFKGKTCENQNKYFMDYFQNIKFYYSKFQLDPIETEINIINEQIEKQDIKNLEKQEIQNIEKIYQKEEICNNQLNQVIIVSEISELGVVQKIVVQMYVINEGLLRPILFSYFPKYNKIKQVNQIQYQQQEYGYKKGDFLKFGIQHIIQENQYIKSTFPVSKIDFKHQNGKCVYKDQIGHNQTELILGEDKILNCYVQVQRENFDEFCQSYQQKLKIFSFLKRFK